MSWIALLHTHTHRARSIDTVGSIDSICGPRQTTSQDPDRGWRHPPSCRAVLGLRTAARASPSFNQRFLARPIRVGFGGVDGVCHPGDRFCQKARRSIETQQKKQSELQRLLRFIHSLL